MDFCPTHWPYHLELWQDFQEQLPSLSTLQPAQVGVKGWGVCSGARP